MAVSLSRGILRQKWLQPAETALQHGIRFVLDRLGPAREPVDKALLGTWLGHPLHVSLTDVPVGAWTAALAFDAWSARQHDPDRRETWERAARGAILAGSIGALAAAATGLAEYEKLEPPQRRLGLVHGLLNLAGAGCYAVSLVRRRRLGRGRRSALAGYGLMLTAARLGGDLVYRHGVGVEPAAVAPAPGERAA